MSDIDIDRCAWCNGSERDRRPIRVDIGQKCNNDYHAAADYVIPSPINDDRLLAELGTAELANQHGRECQVCTALTNMSESARISVQRALAGTIGEEKLATILTRNGYPTGRRAIRNHRRQDHS
jgi:Na+-translocating ferredoxin:NAD+ oxidoreductase RnfG subunit